MSLRNTQAVYLASVFRTRACVRTSTPSVAPHCCHFLPEFTLLYLLYPSNHISKSGSHVEGGFLGSPSHRPPPRYAGGVGAGISLSVPLASSLPRLSELQHSPRWLAVRLERTPERPRQRRFPAPSERACSSLWAVFIDT